MLVECIYKILFRNYFVSLFCSNWKLWCCWMAAGKGDNSLHTDAKVPKVLPRAKVQYSRHRNFDFNIHIILVECLCVWSSISLLGQKNWSLYSKKMLCQDALESCCLSHNKDFQQRLWAKMTPGEADGPRNLIKNCTYMRSTPPPRMQSSPPVLFYF